MISFLLVGVLAITSYAARFRGVDQKLDAYEAQKYCKDTYGTNLATIHNAQDDLDAFDECNLIPGSNGECWIGYRRGSGFQHWYWTSTGSPYASTKGAYENWNALCAYYCGVERWEESYCYIKERYFVCDLVMDTPQATCDMEFTSWYRGDSYDADSNVWRDLSDNEGDIEPTGTALTVVANDDEINGQTYVQGDQASLIRFKPDVVNPDSEYTVFSVARYATGADHRGRIFDGVSNWLSGFWASRTKIAHHNVWITGTAATPAEELYDWIISSDSPHTYRANGEKLDTTNQNHANTNADIGYIRVNMRGSEQSDFCIAELIIIAGLSQPIDKQKCIEAYLGDRYGMDIGQANVFPGGYDNFKPGHGGLNTDNYDYNYYLNSVNLGYIIVGLLLLNLICVLKYCYTKYSTKAKRRYKIVSTQSSDDNSSDV